MLLRSAFNKLYRKQFIQTFLRMENITLVSGCLELPVTGTFNTSNVTPTTSDVISDNNNNDCLVDTCSCGIDRTLSQLSISSDEFQYARSQQEDNIRHITAESLSQSNLNITSNPISTLSPLVDAHCHLQLEPLYRNSEKAVSLAAEFNIQRIVVCGTEPGDDWNKVLHLYNTYPTVVIPNFGLHPWWIKKYYTHTDNTQDYDHSTWFQQLETLLQHHLVAGVGECGLDKGVKEVPYTLQESILLQHIVLAGRYNRTITLHCVGYWDKLLVLLTTYYNNTLNKAHTTTVHSTHTINNTNTSTINNTNTITTNTTLMPASIVLHSCNTMPIHLVQRFAHIPHVYFSVSMSGRDKQNVISNKTVQFVRTVPMDRLLLETDSPDQLPYCYKTRTIPVAPVVAPAPQLLPVIPTVPIVPKVSVITETSVVLVSPVVAQSPVVPPVMECIPCKQNTNINTNINSDGSSSNSSNNVCSTINDNTHNIPAVCIQYNEPALLRHHCVHLAIALQMCPEQLAIHTTTNAYRAFNM